MAFLSLFFPFISFYLLKIRRLDIQKTRNVAKNVEPPIIFALFFKTTRRKTKGQSERGQSLNANRKHHRANVLRNGANHLQRRGRFSGGAFWLFFGCFGETAVISEITPVITGETAVITGETGVISEFTPIRRRGRNRYVHYLSTK